MMLDKIWPYEGTRDEVAEVLVLWCHRIRGWVGGSPPRLVVSAEA